MARTMVLNKCDLSDLDLVFSQENANRPEGIRPSEGGKYVGFGSTGNLQQAASGGDNLTGILSKSWSSFSQLAGAAAGTASSAVKM